MKPGERLLLLAWPRSGSSSLWQILRSHPDLELMPDEPFNESFASWAPGNPDYLARICDAASLDAVLGELFARYRGIKVLSYQLDEELLRHLVLRPGLRIIHLSRRNLLQTAVSDRIAKQARLWNRWDTDLSLPLQQHYDRLEPLDLDDLRGYIRGLAAHLHWVESLLDLRRDGSVLRLRYEDLYFADRQAQHAQLRAVCSFLDLAPLSAPDIGYYLDPQTAKLGRPDTYGQLPNATEIDAALGSDHTGWLFPFWASRS